MLSRIHMSGAYDGLGPIRALGGCELLVDAIGGMQGSNGVLKSVTDRSGLARPVAVVGAPVFTRTKWGGVQPAMGLTSGAGMYLVATLLRAIPQPFTFFVVIDGYTNVTQDNLMNSGATSGTTDAVAYNASGAGKWSQFNTAVVSYTPLTMAAGGGKCIRWDIFHGATSECLRGSTSGGNLNPGVNGLAANSLLGIGARNDGADSCTVTIAACGVFSRHLTPDEMALVSGFFAARYPGMALT